MGKPHHGVVYAVMRRARHIYWFSVQQQKIASNINNSKDFWSEIQPISNVISNAIGDANGFEEISKLFYYKYRLLYNGVLTNDEELRYLREVINKGIYAMRNANHK